jgi:hypothetical protein
LKVERKTSFSPPSTFHPKNFYLNFFPNYLRVLFYHGFKLLLCGVHSFSLTYKLHSRILMYHVFHPFIVKLNLIEDFFFSWIHGVAHDHVLRVSSRKNEWKTTLKIIPKFDINPTPLWWKSWTMRGAPFFLKLNALDLDIIRFSKFLSFGDFVAGGPHLRWWTQNCLWRFLWN